MERCSGCVGGRGGGNEVVRLVGWFDMRDEMR